MFALVLQKIQKKVAEKYLSCLIPKNFCAFCLAKRKKIMYNKKEYFIPKTGNLRMKRV